MCSCHGDPVDRITILSLGWFLLIFSSTLAEILVFISSMTIRMDWTWTASRSTSCVGLSCQGCSGNSRAVYQRSYRKCRGVQNKRGTRPTVQVWLIVNYHVEILRDQPVHCLPILNTPLRPLPLVECLESLYIWKGQGWPGAWTTDTRIWSQAEKLCEVKLTHFRTYVSSHFSQAILQIGNWTA